MINMTLQEKIIHELKQKAFDNTGWIEHHKHNIERENEAISIKQNEIIEANNLLKILGAL